MFFAQVMFNTSSSPDIMEFALNIPLFLADHTRRYLDGISG